MRNKILAWSVILAVLISFFPIHVSGKPITKAADLKEGTVYYWNWDDDAWQTEFIKNDNGVMQQIIKKGDTYYAMEILSTEDVFYGSTSKLDLADKSVKTWPGNAYDPQLIENFPTQDFFAANGQVSPSIPSSIGLGNMYTQQDLFLEKGGKVYKLERKDDGKYYYAEGGRYAEVTGGEKVYASSDSVPEEKRPAIIGGAQPKEGLQTAQTGIQGAYEIVDDFVVNTGKNNIFIGEDGRVYTSEDDLKKAQTKIKETIPPGQTYDKKGKKVIAEVIGLTLESVSGVSAETGGSQQEEQPIRTYLHITGEGADRKATAVEIFAPKEGKQRIKVGEEEQIIDVDLLPEIDLSRAGVTVGIGKTNDFPTITISKGDSSTSIIKEASGRQVSFTRYTDNKVPVKSVSIIKHPNGMREETVSDLTKQTQPSRKTTTFPDQSVKIENFIKKEVSPGWYGPVLEGPITYEIDGTRLTIDSQIYNQIDAGNNLGVRDILLFEAAKVGITSVSAYNKETGQIGSGDNYALLSTDSQTVTTVKNGNVIKQIIQEGDTKKERLYSGHVSPQTNQQGGISRDGEPELEEESFYTEYRKNPDGSYTASSQRLRLEGEGYTDFVYREGGTTDIYQEERGSRSLLISVLGNEKEHTNPRSPFHNALKISESVYARDGKLYKAEGGRLVEMAAAEAQATGVTSQQLESMKRIMESKAEAQNRLTAAQEKNQLRFEELSKLTGTAISTGNFYAYFLGKWKPTGGFTHDVLEDWTDFLEDSLLGPWLQQDPIRESVCNWVDGVKGLETKLPGTDQGNYFVVTPEGFITAGAFINPTKQEILVPDTNDQSNTITKYNYIIDFKVNLDIPKDPLAAYQDPKITDKVGVNLAVRQAGDTNLYQTYLLKDLNSPDKRFIEVQRGSTYYYQDKDGKPLGPRIISESTKNFEEACIIFNRRPFFSVGLSDTNLKKYGFHAVCSPFKVVGGEARTVDEATQDLLKSKAEQQKENEMIVPGAAVANDDASLY